MALTQILAVVLNLCHEHRRWPGESAGPKTLLDPRLAAGAEGFGGRNDSPSLPLCCVRPPAVARHKEVMDSHLYTDDRRGGHGPA